MPSSYADRVAGCDCIERTVKADWWEWHGVQITLIPQLDQGNEEVIRVTLLTFSLKR